jgi:cob(I)alamin adenosyltransferase
MPTFYTKTGDDGYSGLLGDGRVPKFDPRLEAVGTLDEATAALGLARSGCLDARSAPLLLQVQRDLYGLMTEVAATPENAFRFRSIAAEKVTWLEQQTDLLSSQVEMPKEFILPGDSPASAALALARTIVRRAERRVAQLVHAGELENLDLLRYLNRLSSLCFALELVEIQAAGKAKPTLAKESG